jgi:hypothetical protein
VIRCGLYYISDCELGAELEQTQIGII